MTQRRNRSDARRRAAHGLLALSTAAGVVAATGTGAEADVLVYTSGLTTSLSSATEASNQDVFFDFVAGTSGKDPGAFTQYRLNSRINGGNTEVGVTAAGNNNLIAYEGCSASRYNLGETIGPDSSYSLTYVAVALSGEDSPRFNAGDSGYLGFRFAVDGANRFGWADVTINTDYTVTLNRFAQETAPNTAIAAGVVAVPEANPLTLLLLGAAGLGAYRLARGKQDAQQEASA